MVSRTLRIHILEKFFSPWMLSILQPVWDTVALANLFQYAVVSTTVVCIFWRTHYRIFTVADGKDAEATLQHRAELARIVQVARERDNARQEHAAVHRVAEAALMNAPPMHRIVGVGAGDDNAANHPMYHGPW